MALLLLEAYLYLALPAQPLARLPSPRLRAAAAAAAAAGPAGLPARLRTLPEHGTLTAPCDRTSAHTEARLAALWRQAQAGDDVAAQCCACLDCVGGDSRDALTCNSQFGQDLFLYRNFFRCLPQAGSYVDVGAHHPKQLSSTYFLDVCLGWTEGVCVEASPYYAGLFAGSRSCAVVQAAAASGDGGEVHLGSAGARSETQAQAGSGASERVRAATLATLLREANFTIGDGRTGEEVILDFLSVDVEGDELEALMGMPWDSVHARIIMVENVKSTLEVYEFLVGKGYAKFASLAVDDLYYRVTSAPLRYSKDLNYHRQSTAAMRKKELGLETYEHPVLYERQWEHVAILHKITGKIPTE